MIQNQRGSLLNQKCSVLCLGNFFFSSLENLLKKASPERITLEPLFLHYFLEWMSTNKHNLYLILGFLDSLLDLGKKSFAKTVTASLGVLKIENCQYC